MKTLLIILIVADAILSWSFVERGLEINRLKSSNKLGVKRADKEHLILDLGPRFEAKKDGLHYYEKGFEGFTPWHVVKTKKDESL